MSKKKHYKNKNKRNPVKYENSYIRLASLPKGLLSKMVETHPEDVVEMNLNFKPDVDPSGNVMIAGCDIAQPISGNEFALQYDLSLRPAANTFVYLLLNIGSVRYFFNRQTRTYFICTDIKPYFVTTLYEQVMVAYGLDDADLSELEVLPKA